jgi:hypothetical protein
MPKVLSLILCRFLYIFTFQWVLSQRWSAAVGSRNGLNPGLAPAPCRPGLRLCCHLGEYLTVMSHHSTKWLPAILLFQPLLARYPSPQHSFCCSTQYTSWIMVILFLHVLFIIKLNIGSLLWLSDAIDCLLWWLFCILWPFELCWFSSLLKFSIVHRCTVSC